MKKLFCVLSFIIISINNILAQSEDEKVLRQIFDESLTSNHCYNNLKDLCTKIGARLSGSPQAEKAVMWSKAALADIGVDSVYLQPVMVPAWRRGEKEFAEIKLSSGKSWKVNSTALGGSVGTSNKLLTAGVVEVYNFEELEKLGEEKIKGKFVFFNRRMDQKFVNTFDAYSGCVELRIEGPSKAAKYGAVGIILRSLSVEVDPYPHTGILRYDPQSAAIPAIAISTQDSEDLSKQLKRDPRLKFSVKLSCERFPDVPSHNVVAEIKGSRFPEEIVLVGAHLDSWDLGQGAHDDGAGCVQSMEVLRIFKKLGIKPERTIRCVLFMSEEVGAAGAIKYAEVAKSKNEKHIAAIESDQGGFTPRGFDIDGNDEIKKACYDKLKTWAPLLKPYFLHHFEYGFSGVDINKLKDQNVALIGFVPDSQRYFDFHHAATDNIEGVNRRELHMGAASMASLAYLLSKYGL